MDAGRDRAISATTRHHAQPVTDDLVENRQGGIPTRAGGGRVRPPCDRQRAHDSYFGAPGIRHPRARGAVVADHDIVRCPASATCRPHGVARVAAGTEDQIEFTPQWQAIIGLRHDDFRVDLRNNRTGATLRSDDGLLSPRAGLVFKPRDTVSIYAGYSMAYQPRAGEQLASLSASNAALDPETFRNREVGAKWDIRPQLQASVAVYRLDRGNVAITDPADATRISWSTAEHARL